MSVSNSLFADATSVQVRIITHTCVVTARDPLVLGSEGGIQTLVLRFWLFFRSVLRFLCQTNLVFQFRCLLQFAFFPRFVFSFRQIVCGIGIPCGFQLFLSGFRFSFDLSGSYAPFLISNCRKPQDAPLVTTASNRIGF